MEVFLQIDISNFSDTLFGLYISYCTLLCAVIFTNFSNFTMIKLSFLFISYLFFNKFSHSPKSIIDKL